MFKLQAGIEIKVIIPNGLPSCIYRVCLTYNEDEELIPVVYWTENDGFKKGGANAGYTIKKIEKYINDGDWIIVE